MNIERRTSKDEDENEDEDDGNIEHSAPNAELALVWMFEGKCPTRARVAERRLKFR
jgi:hypothetical protein